jgi:hypothetical protein
MIVPDSPWVQEFVNEPILEVFNPGIVHYMIVTENDVIEVLSNEEPTIELFGRSGLAEGFYSRGRPDSFRTRQPPSSEMASL